MAALAEVIDGAAAGVQAPPITPVDRDRPLPLSFAQQRLWFLAQLEPDSVEYNAPIIVPWPGPLNVDALSGALTELVERHEVLRTRLVADPDGEPYQVIDPPPAHVPVSLVDVSAEPDPRAAASRLVSAEARVAIDLATGPLVRASVARISPDEHLVVLAAHHVVSDEWSGRIVRRELPALYAGADLPDLPVQYADFAVWQRQWLSGDVLDSQLAYWQATLADVPVLELPTDRPRPQIRSSAGAVLAFTVPAEVADGLRALARTTNASMFMVVLSAYAILLSRYSGQPDVVVGVPIAGRNRAETEDLIGFFVNTLVLRTDLSGDPDFTELLGRVRERTLAAYAHQDLPFEQLVDALGVDRDRSRTPVFQVLFNYIAGGVRDRRARDDLAAPVSSIAKYDLTLAIEDGGAELSATLEYSTALFDHARMVRMVGHLRELLAALAQDADQALSRLPVLTANERAQVLDSWNATGAPVAAAGVHELIGARAAAVPGRVAVVCGDESLTYAELELRAGKLARLLHDRGVGTETVVGLCLTRGVDMVVAALAVWKAGGAYLPLDPDYPAERLRFMLADSGASVLLGHRAVAEDLAETVGETIWLDAPDPAGGEPLSRPAEPGQAAYLIYTSGSTGRPKGVVVSHRNLVNFLTSMGELTGMDERDVLLAVTTLSFDIAGLELFLPLLCGARLVVADRETVRSPRALADELDRRAVTVLQATPATWQMLVDEGWTGSRRIRALCGGEALPGALADRDRRAHLPAVERVRPDRDDDLVLLSTRSPRAPRSRSAARSPTPSSTSWTRHAAPPPWGCPASCTSAAPGWRAATADRPELTAERFVADPFADGRPALPHRRPGRAGARTAGWSSWAGPTIR